MFSYPRWGSNPQNQFILSELGFPVSVTWAKADFHINLCTIGKAAAFYISFHRCRVDRGRTCSALAPKARDLPIGQLLYKSCLGLNRTIILCFKGSYNKPLYDETICKRTVKSVGKTRIELAKPRFQGAGA